MRENAGYIIITSVPVDNRFEIVIGRHPSAPAKYVCWDCKDRTDYHNGGYCQTYRQAMQVMAERIHNMYDCIPFDLEV